MQRVNGIDCNLEYRLIVPDYSFKYVSRQWLYAMKDKAGGNLEFVGR